jgi:hypothetical protein
LKASFSSRPLINEFNLNGVTEEDIIVHRDQLKKTELIAATFKRLN